MLACWAGVLPGRIFEGGFESENSESQKKWRIGVKTGQKVSRSVTKLWLTVTQARNNLFQKFQSQK